MYFYNSTVAFDFFFPLFLLQSTAHYEISFIVITPDKYKINDHLLCFARPVFMVSYFFFSPFSYSAFYYFIFSLTFVFVSVWHIIYNTKSAHNTIFSLYTQYNTTCIYIISFEQIMWDSLKNDISPILLLLLHYLALFLSFTIVSILPRFLFFLFFLFSATLKGLLVPITNRLIY